MKIGDTILSKEIPHWRSGRYSQVWERAKTLPADEAMPLAFDNKKEAQAFAQGYNHSATRYGLKLALRGNTVYITRNGRTE